VNAIAARASGKQGYVGVFLLGATFCIASFTCSAPIVGALLAGGAQAHGFATVVVGMGVFEIRLPSSVNAIAARASGKQGYVGVFLLGATFVIASFTCSAPIVGALLAGGAQAHGFTNVVVGMGVFGLTMALPFVLLALFPSRLRSLPRSGEWMHTLKVTLGFVELAASLKFISNVDVFQNWQILPRELFLYTAAAITIATSLYLFGLIRLHGESAEISPLRMVFGMLFLILSLFFVHSTRVTNFGVIMSAILPPYGAEEKPAEWKIVADDFERGLETAKEDGKLALVNWTGET